VPSAPKVFISYSHDSDEHEIRVLDLANRLREDGIDAEIDQYETSPPDGWPAWCEQKIEEADFVLLVCTENYLRHGRNKEEGEGLGVVWEARIIRQLIYDDGARTKRFVPVLFAGGQPEHIPLPVRGATHWHLDNPGQYDRLCRQLTGQPLVAKPVLGKITPMPPRESRSGPAAAATMAPPPVPPRSAGGSVPHARAGEVFVGRTVQLDVLAACLLPADATKRRRVAVTGMGGVGKSYLIDRFFIENRAAFPGGYQRLAVDAMNPGSADELLALLADRLKLPAAADDAAIAAALAAPLALVHVENIDTDQAAATAGGLAGRLPGCALVFSARMSALAAGNGWVKAELSVFNEAEALVQFAQELGDAVPDAAALRPIIGALGGLPLALHLAAGHLESGETPEGFLKLLRRKGLSLAPINPADPSFLERSRTRLEAVFALSLAALGRSVEGAGWPAGAWMAAFHALGYGPAAGFGESLGAAIAGLAEDDFADLARAAWALSLLDRVPRGGGTAFRLHPLLAEWGRRQAPQQAVLVRMTGWFCERLPKPATGEAARWNEVHAEIISLIEWLPQVPAEERVAVERAGSQFAIDCGPYAAWLHFCERMLAGQLSGEQQSNALWTLAAVACKAGQPDRAFTAAQTKRDIDFSRGADREAALALGLIADIRFAEGKFQEAWRISAEEQLPIYIRLGDTREQIVTKSRMADVLEKRGELDQAFNMREYLPLSRLQDDRLKAIMLTRLAELQRERGELDDVAEIYSWHVLPIFEGLGDERAVAITKARIGELQGHSDEYDILFQENKRLELFESIGDAREIALTWAKIGNEQARRNEVDAAISIYEKHVLPRLWDSRNLNDLVVARWYLASHLLRRAATGDRTKARKQLCVALREARKMQLARVNQIQQTLREHGLSCD